MMKRNLFLILLVWAAIVACKEEQALINVESVILDKSVLELTEGEEFILTATVVPENATNKEVVWSSSNESVATVSSGKVRALKEGTTTVSVISVDGGNTAECVVTVKSKIYAVESVILDKSVLELTDGEEFILTATVVPENATNKEVVWSSSNKSVATVSSGKVRALKEGTTTVSVISVDGRKTAECEVMVKQRTAAGDVENTEDENWEI